MLKKNIKYKIIFENLRLIFSTSHKDFCQRVRRYVLDLRWELGSLPSVSLFGGE